MDMESKILYARERKFEFGTNVQELKIKLPKIGKGRYDILVEVYDLHTGKNDLAIKEIKTPRRGDPICCAPHGMGDLYAAQFVCVGFHSSPGDGARAAPISQRPCSVTFQ
jgi:hypothetical protein